MATLNIRNLPGPVHTALRVRAALHGRSMEAEARLILTEATTRAEQPESDAEYQQRIHSIQQELSQYLTPATGESIVDQLIAERRLDAQRGESGGTTE